MITRRQAFQLFYYSQLPLVMMAMVLTGTISAVLFQRLQWQPILLVGFSTYFTYSLDNLIDWKKDRLHYPNIISQVIAYHRFSYFLIPTSAFAVISLILSSPQDLWIGILILGASVTMGIVRFSTYRAGNSNFANGVVNFILNRFFISIIWTIVCVFVPIWYNENPGSLKTWRTFAYMFLLIGIFAVIWKFEKSHYHLKKKLIQMKLFPILGVMGIIAIALVIFDVATGVYPLFHLVTLGPPLASIAALSVIANSPILLRHKIALLTLILMFLSSLSAVLHLTV